MADIVPGPTPAGVPHLAIPFAVGADGTAAVVEQDTDPEVVQSVANLVGTAVGTRLLVPAYGTPDASFSLLDPAAVTQAATRWEPRAAVSVTVVQVGASETVSVGVARR